MPMWLNVKVPSAVVGSVKPGFVGAITKYVNRLWPCLRQQMGGQIVLSR